MSMLQLGIAVRETAPRREEIAVGLAKFPKLGAVTHQR